MADAVPLDSTQTQGLAPWAAPYITDYLGKSQALAATPYETYQGPLTAGQSPLQQQAFSGIAALAPPSALGQAATNAGALTGQVPGTYNPNTSDFTSQYAQQYMNPYLQNVLNPQLQELQRQAQITQQQNAAKAIGQGAFGGSRSAIMDAELQRNLLRTMSDTTGKGYFDAYNSAQQQFNTDQGRRMNENQFGANYALQGFDKSLAANKQLADIGQQQYGMDQGILGTQLSAGNAQRGIEGEGIAADYNEFQKQAQFPYQQLQFQRDMISGLPASSISNQAAEPSLISQLTGIGSLLKGLGMFGAKRGGLVPQRYRMGGLAQLAVHGMKG